MQTTARPRPRFNAEKITADMAVKGWNASDLARATRLAPQTIGRFLSGEVQTAKTASAIAEALGYGVRRYFSHVEAA
jgi:transcriptional regulator with XRE-family HTH domain